MPRGDNWALAVIPAPPEWLAVVIHPTPEIIHPSWPRILFFEMRMPISEDNCIHCEITMVIQQAAAVQMGKERPGMSNMRVLDLVMDKVKPPSCSLLRD